MCVFLCHTRSSHIAIMRLCRHGPRQRRLDLGLPQVAGGPNQGPPGTGRRSRGWGRHFADMERDGIYAGEVRRLRAEKQHRLGR